MKRLVMVVGLLVANLAQAYQAEVSQACLNMKEPVQVKFWGNGVTPLVGRYKASISQDQDSVQIKTNWGLNKTLGLNLKSLSFSAKGLGTLAAGTCVTMSSQQCLSVVDGLLTILYQVKEHYSTSDDLPKALAAVDCAIEKVNYFAYRVNDEIRRTFTVK